MKTILGQMEGFGNLFSGLMILFLVVVIMFGIFLLIRSLILWYWKISIIVENQEKQLEEQQKTNAVLEKIHSYQNKEVVN